MQGNTLELSFSTVFLLNKGLKQRHWVGIPGILQLGTHVEWMFNSEGSTE